LADADGGGQTTTNGLSGIVRKYDMAAYFFTTAWIARRTRALDRSCDGRDEAWPASDKQRQGIGFRRVPESAGAHPIDHSAHGQTPRQTMAARVAHPACE